MLLPPLSGDRPWSYAGIEPARSEVTGIFTTAAPILVGSAERVRWGTGDIGVSDSISDASLWDRPEPWRAAALARATSTVRESQAGIEPAVARARSIRHLHHQRWLCRMMRGKPDNK